VCAAVHCCIASTAAPLHGTRCCHNVLCTEACNVRRFEQPERCRGAPYRAVTHGAQRTRHQGGRCIIAHSAEHPGTVLQFGQLGLGDSEDRFSPAPVAALAGQAVALLSCGWRHTIAVSDKGLVYTWGRGVNGQLGQANPVDR
jgi:hypothetical protein